MPSGTFEVTIDGEPPYEERAGVTLSRATAHKQFTGPLEARSEVRMLTARTPDPASAAYVALERIDGELDGRTGSFVVAHLGLMSDGTDESTLRIVPTSGTGELSSISGTMNIEVVDGEHHYTIEYNLE